MKKAIIEIGSNSVRYLLGEKKDSFLEIICEKRIITRLRDSVGKTGFIKDENLNETIIAVQQFLDNAKENNADNISIIATDVLRRATNKTEVKNFFSERIGYKIDILSPNEEARLAFLGAKQQLKRSQKDYKNFLVADIGGGSTEIIYGTDTEIKSSVSIGIGAISLSEKFFSSTPPSATEIEALEKHIKKKIATIIKPDSDFIFIGIGGAVTTAASALMQKEYDDSEVDEFIIKLSQLEALIAQIKTMTAEEIGDLPGVEKKKADIILSGFYILKNLMTYFNVDVIDPKTTGVLYGCF